MTTTMVDKPVIKGADEIIAYVRANPNVRLSTLIQDVSHQVAIDEATVKAAVLRLSSEGTVEITADWTVRVPVDAASAA
jgi:hypothetical protein